MNSAKFQSAYAEQNRLDYISGATLGTIVSIPLNLFCSIMDHFMYRDKQWPFFEARVWSVVATALAWLWFKTKIGRANPRFEVAWFMSPLIMILWMIYASHDPGTPYYAGLNIILLGMGLLTPWAYKQNLMTGIFVLVTYLAISFSSIKTQEHVSAVVNNATFVLLTLVLVASGSVANARQRLREFSLRWELDENRMAIQESNRKLLEMDQVKSRFFANISHELRTPLTLLISPLETLMQRFRLDEETKGLLGTMQANGMRLLKLINDLLDLVRLESGVMQVKREPVEVAEFVKGLASAARQVADDKRLRLETFVDPALGTISADRDKLEKIVLNLVFNALKFTQSGGRVELRAEKQDDRFVLSVTDTGMGISEKNLPHVFDRFWQADDSSKRKYQGVGIGLALVKELAEIQDGTVEVRSQEGKGTTFVIRLPYHKSDPVSTPPAETMPVHAPSAGEGKGTVTSQEWLANLYRRAELFPALTPVKETLRQSDASGNGHASNKLPKLLVADDEPDMLRFLKSQLSSRYHVLEAVDGQQAIDLASQFLPDIILLDMMMPEKDGLQACREIRARTSTQSIPIVLLTARADEETKLAALSAGASDFLAKPFSTTELHVRVRNLVESHHYQRKVSKQNSALEAAIEQLKETESQLVQSEKLASLGRMSAGIIHEINNPLNYATTGLFTLRSKGKFISPEHRDEYAEILQDVEEGIKRVRNIVSDLRMFTHPDPGSRDQVEVAEVVSSSLRFLSNEWKDKVQVHQSIAEHLTIWSNKNMLIHVLVNLLQNSLDALRRKTFDQEQPTIWLEGKSDDTRSYLIVRDNGPGISQEHLDKIFDPFYTTKDVGEGMGLGLSICYRIVNEYDGKIAVKTEPGKFCEFTLDFPVKGRAPEHASA
jgi:signal transduction histidine kinase